MENHCRNVEITKIEDEEEEEEEEVELRRPSLAKLVSREAEDEVSLGSDDNVELSDLGELIQKAGLVHCVHLDEVWTFFSERTYFQTTRLIFRLSRVRP